MYHIQSTGPGLCQLLIKYSCITITPCESSYGVASRGDLGIKGIAHCSEVTQGDWLLQRCFVLGFKGNPGTELVREMASWWDSRVPILARVFSVSGGNWLNDSACGLLWSCPLNLSPRGQKGRTWRRRCRGKRRGKAALRRARHDHSPRCQFGR